MPNILVVDDDPEIREAMRIILEAEGHAVREADAPQACRDAMAEQTPDLLILDVMMEKPDDGFQLSYEFRGGEYKDVPILMVTGVGQATGWQFDPKKDQDFIPVDEYLEKPVKPEALIATIDRILGG